MQVVTGLRDGSAPRLWGTLSTSFLSGFPVRFSPTAVGNASDARFWQSDSAVQPHGCGERGSLVRGYAFNAGSAPRLWGTRTVNASR